MQQWQKNLYTALITQILSLTGFGFVFPFIPFFIQDLGLSDPEQIRLWSGLIAGAPALTMGIMAPIWGLIADRIGKKPMMLRAMLAGSVILIIISRAQSVGAVFVMRLLQGALTGTMTAAGALIATGTPKHRLSSALGLQASANFIGISIGPAVGGIAAELFGYRTSFLIGGGFLFAGFVVVLLVIKDIAADPDVGPEKPHGGSAFTARSFLAPAFVGLFVLLFTARLCGAVTVPFIPLFVQEIRGTIQGSASISGLISAARGAVTAVAGLTLARMGDRYGKERLVWRSLLGAAVLGLPLFWMHELWSFTLVFVASTYFFGAVQPLLQSALSERTPAARRGLLFGVLTTVGNVGWFIAPMLGSFISIRLSIEHVFLAYSVLLFGGTAVGIAVERRQRMLRGA
jgi:MFS transporter, DHA1 family, multidrug resistance protein